MKHALCLLALLFGTTLLAADAAHAQWRSRYSQDTTLTSADLVLLEVENSKATRWATLGRLQSFVSDALGIAAIAEGSCLVSDGAGGVEGAACGDGGYASLAEAETEWGVDLVEAGALSSYAPLASPTFTGTVTFSGGISGVDFADLGTTPSTLAGYGISDASTDDEREGATSWPILHDDSGDYTLSWPSGVKGVRVYFDGAGTFTLPTPSSLGLDADGDGTYDESVFVYLASAGAVDLAGGTGATIQDTCEGVDAQGEGYGLVAEDASTWRVISCPGQATGVASAVAYDNTTSGMTADDVQAAIDELEGRLAIVESGIGADVTAPAAPTGLVATAGDTEIVLTWTDPADADLDEIAVYCRNVSAGGTLAEIAQVAAGTETYTYSPLVNSTEYGCAVASRDASGNESARTAEVTGAPVAGASDDPPVAAGETLLYSLDTSPGTGGVSGTSLLTHNGATTTTWTEDAAGGNWTYDTSTLDGTTPVVKVTTAHNWARFDMGVVPSRVEVAVVWTSDPRLRVIISGEDADYDNTPPGPYVYTQGDNTTQVVDESGSVVGTAVTGFDRTDGEVEWLAADITDNGDGTMTVALSEWDQATEAWVARGSRSPTFTAGQTWFHMAAVSIDPVEVAEVRIYE